MAPRETMDPIAVPWEARPGVPQSLTVSQLAKLIRETVRSNPLLGRVLVRGEVSNLQAAPAGHVFFTLKDASSQVSCILFREDAENLGFELEDGMDVVVSGDVDVFPRKGTVQLLVRAATPAGVGAFWAAYQKTRKKLAAEGLFDANRKRSLPRFPQRIGVVTSEIGAVVHDIVTILRRRYPVAHIVVAPALVQGPGAPASLRRALAAVADRVDVAILARGGGSLEDLWCFNDEGLARAVATCRVPVVSAIGHETDVTIVDFVADVRAATPSAAAEHVSPDAIELGARINAAGRFLVREVREILVAARSRTTILADRLSPQSLRRGVDANRSLLERIRTALSALGPREVARHRDRLDALGRRLDLLSPLATLQRGYAIAETEDGQVIARAIDVGTEESLAVRFQDGRIHVRVNEPEEAP
ncbi:MAG TPA: exodeoxyribonuclease VII large subunit [Thermoplasmata archaeon]|nr:exodeoxyribonuclease VII large subunit [Thermoplasmata archaeon]